MWSPPKVMMRGIDDLSVVLAVRPETTFEKVSQTLKTVLTRLS